MIFNVVEFFSKVLSGIHDVLTRNKKNTINDKMTLAEFNTKYRYHSDISTFGRVEHWVVLEENDSGLFIGDCEDYVLTLIDKVKDFEDLEIWYCKIDDEGHCLGYNVRDNKFIDCNFKRYVDVRYLERYKYTEIRPYRQWELIGLKYLIKPFTWFRKQLRF